MWCIFFLVINCLTVINNNPSQAADLHFSLLSTVKTSEIKEVTSSPDQLPHCMCEVCEDLLQYSPIYFKPDSKHQEISRKRFNVSLIAVLFAPSQCNTNAEPVTSQYKAE